MNAHRVSFENWPIPYRGEQSSNPIIADAIDEIFYKLHIASLGKDDLELSLSRFKNAKRSVYGSVDDLNVFHKKKPAIVSAKSQILLPTIHGSLQQKPLVVAH